MYRTTQYPTKKTPILAFIMLAAMFGLMLGSIINESAIVDELAHIPAGYGYVTELDFRLNPEHPPLLKAVSGLFVRIFENPHFPTDNPAWTADLNGQWSMGYSFLYGSGNNADSIIFWSRIPVILLSIVLGWLLYQWVRRRFGTGAALLMLAFFCFSPTILAHSRYMTTDIGASFGFFIGIASFLRFLEKPTMRNTIIAGVCFGVAQLLKFSLVLLVPIDAIMLILWLISMPFQNKTDWIYNLWRYVKKMLLAICVATLLIWAVYGVFTYNYPPERQLRDTTQLMSSYGFRPAVNFDLWLTSHNLTRPLGYYMLGILMVQQRAAGGNTAFFLDEVTNRGSRLYFPLLYILKEPLPLHIFSLIALFYLFTQMMASRKKRAQGIQLLSWQEAIRQYFVEWSCVVMIAVYWLISIKSPLNIGIRHVLPTFPFIYILVSVGIMRWMRRHIAVNPTNLKDIVRNIFAFVFSMLPQLVIVTLLIIWLILGTITATPSFLSYYNELAGGTSQGWRIAVDSNYDWGQDLKRLNDFVEANNITHISLDYFGGGVGQYYMGSRVTQWSGAQGQPKGWFAISSTFRQGEFGTPIDGLVRTNPGEHYEWLKQYPPVARAGQSIFIYKLPE
ncbi:MAG: glycosyltransferase family 39 protein [bacterium]|nr:glycosyltransferase family 39 protein [bacterium]